MQFTFDQKRVDYIINVLAQRPYAEVAETLQDIATQIQQQRNPLPLTGEANTKANGNGAAQHQESAP